MKSRFYCIKGIIILLLLSITSCSTEKHYNEWVEKEGNYYYYDYDGKKVKDIGKIVNEDMYYFDDSGKMLTGWQKIDNKDVYLGNDGKMKTGWNYISENWYFFNDKGSMQTGWIEDNNNWYYCKDSGQMARGEWTNDDYYVDNAGVMRKGLGNGYVSCVTTANDTSFNLDLNEVEYGSNIDFLFMRKYDNDDEVIVVEQIQPNGQIAKENFNWRLGQNIVRTQIQNCNISGEWKEKIYDESRNLLAENSVIVKPNPNQTYVASNINKISIKARIENANFNDETIKSLLEELESCKNEIDYGDGNLKAYYFDRLFTFRDLLVDILNVYRVQGAYENDVRLAEEFMRELGLKSK